VFQNKNNKKQDFEKKNQPTNKQTNKKKLLLLHIHLSPTMPLQLHYFQIRGRAELARLILHQAGVEYEEVYISDWPTRKASGFYPFGQLPVLVEDGTVIAQSFAIARHLARVNGLAGKNETEATFADVYSEQLLDTFNKLVKAFFFSQDKAKDVAAFFDNDFQPLLAPLEKVLANSKNGFFSENLTYADLFAFDLLDSSLSLRPNSLDNLPHFKKQYEAVKALPNIAAYLPKRLPPPTL